MSLLQRLRNLWGWSKITPPNIQDELDLLDEELTPIFPKKRHGQAQIIKMKSPVQEFLDTNKNK